MADTKTTKNIKTTAEPLKKGDTPKKLKLLVTVINREKTEYYTDLLENFEVNVQFSTAAEGTAQSEVLQVLGLQETEKTVLFSLIREDRAAEILETLQQKFDRIKNGKGVAFTVPLTGVIGLSIYQFLSNNRMESEGE